MRNVMRDAVSMGVFLFALAAWITLVGMLIAAIVPNLPLIGSGTVWDHAVWASLHTAAIVITATLVANIFGQSGGKKTDGTPEGS